MKINFKHSTNWFLVFWLLIQSSHISIFSFSDIIRVTSFILIGILFIYKKQKLDKAIALFTASYILLSVFYLIDFGWLNFSATTRMYIKIMYSYLTIKLVGPYFFKYFEDVVYKLALISLPMYLFQIVFPTWTWDFMNLFSFLVPKGPVFVGYLNAMFFTLNEYALDRNSGFMWEPSGFGAILSIALPINLIFNDFRIINKKFIVMLIALLTTFSTTAYVNLLLIGIFFLFNSNKKYRLLIILTLVPIVVLIQNLDFVSQKIQYHMSNNNSKVKYDYLYTDNFDRLTIGRFGSLMIDYNDLVKRPTFGYGLQFTERTKSPYIEYVRSNGFSDYMAIFGVAGILFLIYNLQKTFNSLKKWVSFNAPWVLTFIILCSSFSTAILTLTAGFAFQTYYVAVRQYKNEIVEEEEIEELSVDLQKAGT